VIEVTEVVVDPDMIAPRPFTVMRSTGEFILGGFQSLTRNFDLFGPVQQASDREINMLPEADRQGSIRSFWATVPLFVTRGFGPLPSVHGEAPQGALPGGTFTLSAAPPGGAGSFTVNGLLQRPSIDYALTGNIITMLNGVSVAVGSVLFFQWPVTVNAQAAASDIIQYENTQYRVLRVYRDPGSGFWRALGTQMQAA
jgi:hypothetical protein